MRKRKEFYNTLNNNYGLHMVNCGYEDYLGPYAVKPRTISYYLIHYIIKGEGFFKENGRLHKACADDIFIIHPDEVISYYSLEPDNLWSYCWIGFDGEHVLKYMEDVGITENTRVLKLNNHIMMKNIMEAVNYFERSHCICETKLNAILLNCLSSIQMSIENKKRVKVDYVTMATGFIIKNYTNVTVNDVVKYVNLDRSYFYRIFKKETGRSPEQFIIEYRIEQAVELIKCGQYPLSQIADLVGISNIYYFSKLFKKHKGVNLTEYKKALLEQSGNQKP